MVVFSRINIKSANDPMAQERSRVARKACLTRRDNSPYPLKNVRSTVSLCFNYRDRDWPQESSCREPTPPLGEGLQKTKKTTMPSLQSIYKKFLSLFKFINRS